MLLDDFQRDVLSSLKKGDAVRVQTLRFLISGIRNFAISQYGKESEAKLTDAGCLEVVKKQVKTHKESIDAYVKANRPELVQKEKEELLILEAFLPKQLTDEQLKELLEPIAKSGETNFGLLMKQAMAVVKGQAEGSRVSAILRQLIS